MTIPTQMSLHGFIATAPTLDRTSNAVARFYARIGVEQFRKDADGAITRLDSTFHDLVLFGRAAEQAHTRLRVGDQFVACGYVQTYDLARHDANEAREQFVARRIGHDCARTPYTVERTPTPQPDPHSDQLTVANSPAQVAGL